MEQKDFHLILKKYLQGRATEAEEMLIDSWYADMGKDAHSSLNRLEESELEKQYWSAISTHIKQNKKSTMRWYSIGMAASLMLALVSYLGVVHYRNTEKGIRKSGEVSSFTWEQIVNTGKVTRVIILPDSSKVMLEPQSRLKFLTSFPQSRREVFLEGEAFFEVSHNVNRPFLVYANKVITKVLGTSFMVKAFQLDKNVTVAVKTGKVSVYATDEDEKVKAEPDEIILTPNQKIIYDKNKKKISRMIVETPQAILPAEELKRMRFEEASVIEIFEAIEKVYGVDIVFDERKFSSCILTTCISDGGIFNRLDIICVAINASYKMQENQIVVNGRGCKNH